MKNSIITPPKYFINIYIGLISFGIVFCITMMINRTDYPYDSGYYYKLSQSFFSDGIFSIANYPNSYRGIIFPLILCFFNKISGVILGSEVFGWRLLISLLSCIFTMVYPLIFKPIGKIHFVPIPLFLLLLVWRGLFLVPLSDLISAFFLIFALSGINKSYSNIRENSFTFRELFIFFLTGILLYAAYNIRTIYLFALPFVLLIVFCNRHIGKLKSILVLCSIIFGIFSLGCVQGISNKLTLGNFSLTVQSQSIFSLQLHEGMKISLYETYMGEERKFAKYRYKDISGSQVTEVSDTTYAGYLKSFFKYPIESLGLYVRHIFALLNPIGGGGYVYSHNNSRFFFTLLNYTMLFIVINFLRRMFTVPSINIKYKRCCSRREFILCAYKIKTKKIPFSLTQKTSLLSLIIILVPFLAIIPGAVEERFAISFWLIVYGLLSYVIDLRQEFLNYKTYPISYALSWLGGFGIFVAILTAIYANNPQEVLLPILKFGG